MATFAIKRKSRLLNLKKKLKSPVMQKIGCGIEIKAQWIIQSAARRNKKVKVQDVFIYFITYAGKTKCAIRYLAKGYLWVKD